MLVRSSWQFLAGEAGGGGSGTALWSSDWRAAQSVMHYPLMLGMNQVNYHKQTGRYLLANYG